MTDLTLAWGAFIMALFCLALLVPVYGKLFFSTHQMQYLPLEEYLKVRKELGLKTAETTEDQAAKVAHDLTQQLFGVAKEDFKATTYKQPVIKKARPLQPDDAFES